MNSGNAQYNVHNNVSNKSIALSIVCTLILITMLISSNEPTSWLLRLSLVVWLVHITLSQICAATDFQMKQLAWFQDIKFSFNLAALDLNVSTIKSRNKIKSNTQSAKPDLSSVWKSKAIQATALRIARMLVITGTFLMKLNGVRDNTLRGELSPSHFYRECWLEDIALRDNAKKQLSFSFKCLTESCVFIYEDGYAKRTLQSNLISFNRTVWQPLCKQFRSRRHD